MSQRDVKIRVLEIEIEKLRTELAELSVYKAKEETEGELPHSANALVE